MVQRYHEDQLKAKREAESELQTRRGDGDKEKLPDITMTTSERATFIPEHDDLSDDESTTPVDEKEKEVEPDDRERGSA